VPQLLETRALKKSFGGVHAVDELDFHVDEGEILGVIGPNGSGKTTLFNLITGFLSPTQGQVFFQGKDVTGLASHRIARRGIVRTFQLNLLFNSFTVLDNVAHAYHLHRKTGPIGAFFRPRRVRDEEAAFLQKGVDLELILSFIYKRSIFLNLSIPKNMGSSPYMTLCQEGRGR